MRAGAHGLIARLDRVLRASQVLQRVLLHVQPGGDELDLDAVVRANFERRSGDTHSQKLYQRIEHRDRDVATLLLLDTSTSIGDITPNDGRTVLDLARDAALQHVLRNAGRYGRPVPAPDFLAPEIFAFSTGSGRCPKCCRRCTCCLTR